MQPVATLRLSSVAGWDPKSDLLAGEKRVDWLKQDYCRSAVGSDPSVADDGLHLGLPVETIKVNSISW